MFLAPVTQWYNTTREPKIKCLNPATDTRSKKMGKVKCLLGCANIAQL